ncbi:hypothetical protein N7466_001291 [Penicillium verhagenii]|uniref:uncharacterized protein n=1 Tax=Penicillium verhagenii TaxID=1562060 RepID=UPI002544E01D|nr:uncharacterized protein N7466_001291 [Penicillium verhagenii]KAJ5948276.1 hypothetical protein N7466_001291 [Penicillium verhagenii]
MARPDAVEDCSTTGAVERPPEPPEPPELPEPEEPPPEAGELGDEGEVDSGAGLDEGAPPPLPAGALDLHSSLQTVDVTVVVMVTVAGAVAPPDSVSHGVEEAGAVVSVSQGVDVAPSLHSVQVEDGVAEALTLVDSHFSHGVELGGSGVLLGELSGVDVAEEDEFPVPVVVRATEGVEVGADEVVF